MTDFLYQRIDYEKTPQFPYKKLENRLDRMRALLARLDNPQDKFPIIHVAGTKGKGSTAAMIAAILTAAGYQTGLYTSPHIEQIQERIRWQMQPIPVTEWNELLSLIEPHVLALDEQFAEHGGPTFFEITTAMALLAFARQQANAVVLEVGLGGRLDSTNVVQPVVSVITSIGFDHQKQLGRTLSTIAREKAGIIKPGRPLIHGVTNPEPREQIELIAQRQGCAVTRLGRDFDVQYVSRIGLEQPLIHFQQQSPTAVEWRHLELGLWGRHQANNAAMALATINELRQQGWSIHDAAIRQGLATLRWPARIERCREQPLVILDTAHNVLSLAALLETVREQFPHRKRWVLFATSKDKPVSAMLRQLLPATDELILTQFCTNPRAVPVEQLSKLAEQVQIEAAHTSTRWHRQPCNTAQSKHASSHNRTNIQVANTPSDGWQYIQSQVDPSDLVLIVGSFFLAAELRSILTKL